MFHVRRVVVLLSMLSTFLFSSCYRDEIRFPGDLPDSYTKIIRVDTVTPLVSTVVIDSFVTGGATRFLLGEYADPQLGVIAARAFMQLGLPSGELTLPDQAVYDSLELIIALNHYSYGDTTVPVTIDVHELEEELVPGYNNQLYNTSRFATKPLPLGSLQTPIRPSMNDSLTIRLSDVKGLELFNKLKQKADEIASSENFLHYFKGIRLSAGSTNNAAIYGIGGGNGIRMRLHYHTHIPYHEAKHFDFPAQANGLAFRQIRANRNGTLPDPVATGRREFFSSETNNLAFTQSGTGVLMKIVFPGLRNVLSTDMPMSLLHAELIVRPQHQSFRTWALPPSLKMIQTNESNSMGEWLADSTGQALLTAAPVVDHLYGINHYYRFNVTAYINQLMHTPGSSGTGFYLLENTPEADSTVNRAVFDDAFNPKNKVQLVLSMFTVNTN